MIVSRMIATAMLWPTSVSSRTSTMNRVLKIGVKAQARSSTGLAPGGAGVSGAWE